MSNKKEEKRKIRAEKAALGKQKEKLASLAWKAVALILVPLVVIVLYQGLHQTVTAPLPDEVSAADHIRGTPDAAVTLTVYADFECPACAEEMNLLGRAWPRIGLQVQVVFRHYPLDTHRHAFLAARYAEAAGRQGQFWGMHDLLFSNQGYWAGIEDPVSMFDSFAEQLQLDLQQLKLDVDDPLIREKIIDDQRGGVRAGVRSTPTLFVNGKLVNNPRSASEMTALVNDALEKLVQE